jgi:hypothetical protein
VGFHFKVPNANEPHPGEEKTKQDLKKCAMRNITFLGLSPGAYPPFATLKRHCGNYYERESENGIRKTITNIKFPEKSAEYKL